MMDRWMFPIVGKTMSLEGPAKWLVAFLNWAIIVAVIGASTSPVWAGKAEVEADINELVNHYLSTQCLNESNFLYGSVEGCATQGNQESLGIDYVCTATYMTAWNGIRTGNSSMINRSILMLNSYNTYIGDKGGFPAGRVLHGVSNPPSWFAGVCLGKSYQVLEPYLNETENASIIDTMQQWVAYNTFLWDEISYGEVGGGPGLAFSESYADRLIRKQLNISEGWLTDMPDLFVRVRFASVEGSPSQAKGEYATGYIQYPNQTFSYPLERINGLGDSGFVWMKFNKSYVESCPKSGSTYMCNITLGNITQWDTDNNYKFARQNNGSSGASWVSVDNGNTWTAQGSHEYVLRIVGYNLSSTNITRLYDADHVINQMHGKGVGCLLISQALGPNDPYYNTSVTCYDNILERVINTTKDGVYSERNTLFKNDPGASAMGSYYGGWSPLYNYLNMFLGMIVVEETGNASYTQDLREAVNFSYHTFLDDNLQRANGFGTRALKAKEPEMINTFAASFGVASMLYLNETSVDQLAIRDAVFNYQRYYPTLNQSGLHSIGFMGYPWVYDHFPDSDTGTPLYANDYTSRAITHFDSTQTITARTLNTTLWWNYGNTTPSGGILSQWHDGVNQKELTASRSALYILEELPYGGLSVVRSANCSNYHDPQSTAVVGSTWPLSLNFSGTMRHFNQTDCGINYDVKWTVHDMYIEAEVNTSSSVRLSNWVYGLGDDATFAANKPQRIQDITILPINHSYTAVDRNNWTEYGGIDELYATGTSFEYVIGTLNESTGGEYVMDDDGERLHLPIWISGSNYTHKNISNGLTHDVIVDVRLDVDPTFTCAGIVGVEYRSHSGDNNYSVTDYTCAGNVLTINDLSDVEPAQASNQVIISYDWATLDQSGNGRNLTESTGVTYNTTSQRYEFDGTGNGLLMPAYTFSESYSVSTWFKVNTCSDGAYVGEIDQSQGAHRLMLWSDDYGACARIGAQLKGGGSTIVLYGTNNHAIGGWNHMVFTYNGSHGAIYVNGVLDSTPTVMPSLDGLELNDPYIGSDSDGGKRFNGAMDSFTMWNRSLNATEISLLSQNLSVQCGDDTHRYPFSSSEDLCAITWDVPEIEFTPPTCQENNECTVQVHVDDQECGEQTSASISINNSIGGFAHDDSSWSLSSYNGSVCTYVTSSFTPIMDGEYTVSIAYTDVHGLAASPVTSTITVEEQTTSGGGGGGGSNPPNDEPDDDPDDSDDSDDSDDNSDGAGLPDGFEEIITEFCGAELLEPASRQFSIPICQQGTVKDGIEFTYFNPFFEPHTYEIEPVGLDCAVTPAPITLLGQEAKSFSLDGCACPDAGEVLESSVIFRDLTADGACFTRVPVNVQGTSVGFGVYVIVGVLIAAVLFSVIGLISVAVFATRRRK